MGVRCKQFAPPSSKGSILRQLSVYEKNWPVAGSFTISRSSLTTIPTVWVEITEKGHVGRAECRPYARYGDTVKSVISEIERVRSNLESGADHSDINRLMRPGPARNAIDCAIWDLEAKITGKPVYERLGVPKPQSRITAFTLSLQKPRAMAKAALEASNYPLLKIKVDGSSVIECSLAVIESRPDARLIIDANEDLSYAQLTSLVEAIPHRNIAMIEQPLKSDIKITQTLPTKPIICADESLHSNGEITRDDLQALWDQGFRAVNIKLDKCGGLSAAFELMKLAKEMDFKIMAGCMVGSSLAMAPMLILESFADILDLDGPLLLSEDCENGLFFDGANVSPPPRDLWG
jgi:L-alanine-DL-glutamate epimerase-like enolase superfamily enzyme